MNTLSPEQITEIVQAIKHAAQPATLTSLADWPLLAVLASIIMLLIGAMWRAVNNTINDQRLEMRLLLTEIKEEQRRQIDFLWKALRDCQNERCSGHQRNSRMAETEGKNHET